MKTLEEMSVGELEALKADVDAAIRRGGEPGALLGFWRAIDDELDRRGA